MREGGLTEIRSNNAEDQGGEHLITVHGVEKTFGGIRALTDARLSLMSGEIHGVIGENGSGKSTLLRIISGLETASRGNFMLRGAPVEPNDVRRLFRKEVSLVSQELSLANDLSVGENIVLRSKKPGHFFKVNWHGVHREAREVLESLGIELDTHQRAGALPLAMRQLVEIARVIAQRSPVMILDEPTSALSDQDVEPLFTVLRQLADRGTAVVIVTHRLEELLGVSDRLTVLRDGRTVESSARSDFDRASLVRSMLGHDPEVYAPPSTGRAESPPVLSFGGIPVRSNSTPMTSMEVREREVLGLFGLADSGCSTLLAQIAGATSSAPGMTLDGETYQPRTPAEALRRGVGYVPADRASAGLIPMMSVLDNIHVGTPNVRSRVRRISGSQEIRSTNEFVRSLGVKLSSSKAPVQSLSGGNQQKVLLAKALVNNPRLLALEEPTRGVDIGAKDEIHRILHGLRDEGMSLVVVSTDIEEMLLLCDRFYVLRAGAITGELTRAEASQARLMHLASAA